MLQKNAENFNTLLQQPTPKGVIIAKIEAGGFLESASLQKRDVIVSMNCIKFDRHGIVIGKEGNFRHKNIFDVIKLIPIGDDVEITFIRNGEIITTHATAIRNPEKGVVSQPIIVERQYIDIFGMIIQELNFEIIEVMNEIDANARIDMLQSIDLEKPILTVTHIHQGTQADEREWPVGELRIKANEEPVHSLGEDRKSGVEGKSVG